MLEFQGEIWREDGDAWVAWNSFGLHRQDSRKPKSGNLVLDIALPHLLAAERAQLLADLAKEPK
jgi:hypothetical protein